MPAACVVRSRTSLFISRAIVIIVKVIMPAEHVVRVDSRISLVIRHMNVVAFKVIMPATHVVLSKMILIIGCVSAARGIVTVNVIMPIMRDAEAWARSRVSVNLNITHVSVVAFKVATPSVYIINLLDASLVQRCKAAPEPVAEPGSRASGCGRPAGPWPGQHTWVESDLLILCVDCLPGSERNQPPPDVSA